MLFVIMLKPITLFYFYINHFNKLVRDIRVIVFTIVQHKVKDHSLYPFQYFDSFKNRFHTTKF